ncbi:hypothetical protein RI543_000078 [Arxiozyma heterogenica]|uniref:Helicase SWR1 n=1 Tax=Arxiozyma heterogenica TaxID=278026 RepID=A0AAN7WNI2_9SACH|nr:hypothetical protein RI543_000078 [Kazachstania heterogenica]
MARYSKGTKVDKISGKKTSKKSVKNPIFAKKETSKDLVEQVCDPKTDLLIDSKIRYDLLTNELFHLKEYVSLVGFDPLHSNDNNMTFQKFLKAEGFSLDEIKYIVQGDESSNSQRHMNDDPNTIPNKNNNINNTNENVRIRRIRSLRSSSLSPTNNENDISNNNNNNKHIKDLAYKLEKIQPLVSQRLNDIVFSKDNKFILIPKNKTSENNNISSIKKYDNRKINDITYTTTTITDNNNNNIKKELDNQKLLLSPGKCKKRKYDVVTKQSETINHGIKSKSNVSVDRIGNEKNGQIVKISKLYDDSTVDDEYYYFTASSDDELPKKKIAKIKKTSSTLPRIHLYVNPPKQTVVNPENIVIRKYKNVREYLNTFKSLEEDMTLEEYNSFIQDLRTQVTLIREGLEKNILKYDLDSNSFQPVTTKETKTSQFNKPDPISYFYKEQNKHTFDEFLVNQGIYMSKLFQNSKKARIARAKKVSQMIEQHFKHIASADERKRREEEKQRKSIGRTITQAVKKRWNLAEKAYRVLKREEDDKLKTIQGKKHLSKMLEKSTQLLGAQLNKQDKVSDEELSDRGSIRLYNNNENNELNSDTYDDDFLSSSSIEEEDNDVIGVESRTNDENNKKQEKSDRQLSTKELQEKYNKMKENNEVNLSESDDSSSMLTDENEDSNVSSASDNEDSTEENSKFKPNCSTGLSSLFDNNMDGSDLDDSDDFVMSETDDSDFNNQHTIKNELNLKLDNCTKDEHFEVTKPLDNYNKELQLEDEQLSVVDVPVPSLLRGTLRTYQKQGLNWLASLYNNHTNGILADEMGLGKTIQTISLLAYLACEKHIWGPHLIVVPTSVLLNWEMEFKRFAPGLKVLTYYGSPQQRKEKRKGWNKPDAFHVCIVSYQLVVQDQNSFKRKKWHYMVLDEAHNIKNFRSNRWQALLNFNTERRLLLTGTPLQNNLAELWSLLYFLMPQTIVDGKRVSGFADLDAFQQWFGRPVNKIIETSGGYEHDLETKQTVDKLHQILRPYLLRRLKKDVEKQMPAKYEHIVYCRLSKRQRYLYDEFMSRSQTKETLASGNFMSIVNCLMQLRKVCNHPDLFEVRPIVTSFATKPSVTFDYNNGWRDGSLIPKMLPNICENRVNLHNLNLIFTQNELNITGHHAKTISKLACVEDFVKEVNLLRKKEHMQNIETNLSVSIVLQNPKNFYELFTRNKTSDMIQRIEFQKYINILRCNRKPIYGNSLLKLLTINQTVSDLENISYPLITPLQTRFLTEKQTIDNYAILTPNAVSLDIRKMTLGIDDSSLRPTNQKKKLITELSRMDNPFHHLQTKLTIAFPDKMLLQYDCGKLQKLATLLQELKDNGHRALIFTQMTKVLDILEQFLNYHGYLYMRLDGATKIEDRQILTERFNTDPRITVFILSSRSGGLGINLTGADTVIFYDSDWNPAMDKQCQDRCHRIGQTRDVHIYRFVSEHTIESNILKKANQKRQLDNVVIQKGDFTTDYFSKLSVRDLFGSELTEDIDNTDKPLLLETPEVNRDPKNLEKLLAQAEDEDDVKAANLAMKEVDIDNEDFEETSELDSANGTTKDIDEYEGTNHIEEYMLRFIANGFYS